MFYLLLLLFSLFLFLLYLRSYLRPSEFHPHCLTSTWPTFQSHPIWSTLFSYFPSRVLLSSSSSSSSTSPPPPSPHYLYLIPTHPHGVMSVSHLLLLTDAIGFLSTILPLVGGRRDIGASILFRIPILREVVLWLGCVDASAKNCHALLERSVSLQLYSGGEQEQVQTNSSQPLIYASRRRGFIRLGIEYGARILPVYIFGEDQLYTTSSFFLSFRLWIVKKFRVAIPIAWGRWGSPIIPFQRELVVVVGEAIVTVKEGEEEKKVREKGERRERRTDVTEEEIDSVLKKYVEAVERLYNNYHKEMKGYENKKLIVL